MTHADVIELLDVAVGACVGLWLDGGWAVDALLGVQTRMHDDLDILIERRHERSLVEALRRRGFHPVERPDTRSWNYVLGDDRGREVDLHVIERRADGAWDYGPPGGNPEAVMPAHALSGHGSIAGRKVRCVAPADLVRYHTGYRVDEKDWADVRALCARFGLPIPADYRKFHRTR